MKIANLSLVDFRAALQGHGLYFRIGPFTTRLRTTLQRFPEQLLPLYGLYDLVEDHRFADQHMQLCSGWNYRRCWEAGAKLLIDGRNPFYTFPRILALPFYEWGLNWCVYNRAHQYLMIHSAVVERNGQALILPGMPRSGKSTLCAALIHRGWRLLSDEFALLRPEDNLLTPYPRLIPLKDESIAVIRDFAPEAVLGETYPNTRKGNLSHLRPPAEHIERSGEQCPARWVIFPRFQFNGKLRLDPLTKIQTFLKLTGNSFNYENLGLTGFQTMTRLVDSCDGYAMEYGSLDDALGQIDELTASPKRTTDAKSSSLG